LADLIADGLPTQVVTHQLQVERGTGKVHCATQDLSRSQLWSMLWKWSETVQGTDVVTTHH